MKKNSPHHLKKQARKAVHSAQDMEYEADPKHLTEEQEKQYLSSGKEGKMAEGRQNSHHSKRTSPEEVGFETAPEYPNKEGAHWDAVKKSQSLDKAKRIDEKYRRQNKK